MPNLKSQKSRLVTAHNLKRWAFTREMAANRRMASQKRVFRKEAAMRSDEHDFFCGDTNASAVGVGKDSLITNVGLLIAAFNQNDSDAMLAPGLKPMSISRAKLCVADACVEQAGFDVEGTLLKDSIGKCVKHSFDGTPATVKDSDGSLVKRRHSFK